MVHFKNLPLLERSWVNVWFFLSNEYTLWTAAQEEFFILIFILSINLFCIITAVGDNFLLQGINFSSEVRYSVTCEEHLFQKSIYITNKPQLQIKWKTDGVMNTPGRTSVRVSCWICNANTSVWCGSEWSWTSKQKNSSVERSAVLWMSLWKFSTKEGHGGKRLNTYFVLLL